MDFAGKVIAITGGARGIGRATSHALLARGAKVSIGDLDPEAAPSDCTGRHRLDVRSRESFQRFLDITERELGPVDVLVNNAGIMPVGRLIEEDDETSWATIGVNIWGVLLGMKLVLPRMLDRGRGQVINIASMAGKVPLPGAATYTATKHAVLGLTDAAREEIRESGVLLTAVLPTTVRTEMSLGIPMGRGLNPVSPDDVAEAVVRSILLGSRNVYVPRNMKAVGFGMSVLPRRLAGLVRRLARDDRLLSDLDRTERVGYERRLR